MKFLRGIRVSLAARRMKVPLDPRLHLSCRVVRLEQPDDAGIGFDGFEHVLEDQLVLDLALGRRRGAELLDDGDDVGLLEQLAKRATARADGCSNSGSGSALPRDPILFKPNQIPQNAAAPAAIGVIPNCGNPKKIAAE